MPYSVGQWSSFISTRDRRGCGRVVADQPRREVVGESSAVVAEHRPQPAVLRVELELALKSAAELVDDNDLSFGAGNAQ